MVDGTAATPTVEEEVEEEEDDDDEEEEERVWEGWGRRWRGTLEDTA